MKVLYAAAEAAPFFKTGGLGDVAYALPKALARAGVDIRVVLPYYSQMPVHYQEAVKDLYHFRFQLGHKNVYCGLKYLELEGVHYYFVDNLAYFDRPSLYGQWDDGERFAFFSTAIIEMLEVIDWIPDILHCNDWHTAMVPVLLVDRYHWRERLQHIRKVLTIHNLRFQGIFDKSILPDVFGTGFNVFTEDGVKYYDKVNYLKGGINFSDRVTTVSPSYAEEIKTTAFGEHLEDVLAYNDWKLSGILNGIDYELNDPATDPHISVHYEADTLEKKQANKAALQAQLGLPVNSEVPVIGLVSRLTDQKGFQLVEAQLAAILAAGVQVVIVGTGEAHFEASFKALEDRYPDRLRVLITFNIPLAQQVYAGADMFLMPSAFEPCGLSQMMAMRYGTLPIVHETGGLRDTVIAYNKYTGEGTGFSFNQFDSDTLYHTVMQAIYLYRDQPDVWQQLMNQAMRQDFSWQAPTQAYIKLYQNLLDDI